MKRREFLKVAAAGASLPLFNILVPEARGAKLPRPMNVVIFITDQERSIQHFPQGWARRNLPCTNVLQRNGITFTNACCPSSMCSPSRASLFSGMFPAQHQVVDTLEFGTDYPAQQLPFNITNMAHVMHGAGYDVVFKGKWHLSLPNVDSNLDHPSGALKNYGFHRWEPPDAGANQDLDQFGGGNNDADKRFVRGFNQDIQGQEGAIDYINRAARKDKPFCLIVSLVNPHDVLSYPNTYIEGGYTDHWLKGEIGLPKTYDEDLSTKPIAQRSQRALLDAGIGVLTNNQERLNYLNFYGNLMKRSDRQLLQVYRALERNELIDDTLIIRTSDHGEMGLAHGGLRQKNFNFYEETIKIPMVFSNPILFPQRLESDALVSHVDLVPTLGSLVNSPVSSSAWQGVDYSHLIVNKGKGHHPQDYVVFTFDDVRTGQNLPATALPPNHIISIREERYKLARYYDPAGRFPDQYEMYDLHNDPLETKNLASPMVQINSNERSQLNRMMSKLSKVVDQRLKPLHRDLVPGPRIY